MACSRCGDHHGLDGMKRAASSRALPVADVHIHMGPNSTKSDEELTGSGGDGNVQRTQEAHKAGHNRQNPNRM